MTGSESEPQIELNRPEDLLETKSGDELLSMLRAAWRYGDQEPLEIIGRLINVARKEGNKLYWLADLRSVKDGSSLLYPVDRVGLSQNVYVYSRDAESLNLSGVDRPWLRARVNLSPLKERQKKDNPFALSVVSGSLRLLSTVPDDWSVELFDLDDKLHFEEAIVEMLRQQHAEVFDLEREALEGKNRALSSEADRLEQDATGLRTNMRLVTKQRDAISAEITCAQEQLRCATKNYIDGVALMTNQLSQLRGFVEKRVNSLLELDLIDETHVHALLGTPTLDATVIGHSLESDFNGSLQGVVQYIQTYLHRKGIYYTQAVLADFFALLRTNDLVILAGDSGSGKTNLVKSFAEAIGGRAVILPVKPNWTSSEDLLGYYNPIEKRYLATPFLNALIEAARNPTIPYLICLDEMNLARVEYYFADFLSLLEERSRVPEINLYSSADQSHALSEYKTFLSLVDEAKARSGNTNPQSFVELLKNEDTNQALRKMCGFHDGDSLLRYHAHLRRILGNSLNLPCDILFPTNVRIVGAINVDETTHYLSPKILDRAHIVRFINPLLIDWDALEQEVVEFDLDISLPLALSATDLGERLPYPDIDREDEFVQFIFSLTRGYLDELGVEVGLRTVRQARNYAAEMRKFGASENLVRNNFVIHKVFPKLMFDGQKSAKGGRVKKDVLQSMHAYLTEEIPDTGLAGNSYCVSELADVIRLAESNDWIVNYWSR